MLIGGVDVVFPFKPYPSQIAVASQVIKALQRKENALLESPTGTGKTLALLCSALAYQEKCKLRNAGLTSPLSTVNVNGDKHIVISIDDDASTSSHARSAEIKDENEQPVKVPKIYFCSRTHAQLSKVCLFVCFYSSSSFDSFL